MNYLGRRAIAMAGRRRKDKKLGVAHGPVENTMRDGRPDLNSLPRREIIVLAVDLERQNASQHIEELCGTLVEVAAFRTARRNPLLDDAVRAGLGEAPSLADPAPPVMLRIALIDHAH